MRFYNIIISYPNDPTAIVGGVAVGASAGKVKKVYSSFVNGVFDPAALNVEIDIPIGAYASPLGYGTVMIEGIALKELSNASDFAGLVFTMYAGMSKGLPLANVAQQGLILSGLIYQSFGNWQGTEMSLNFVIAPSVYSYDNPGDLVLNWIANTPLVSALETCLSNAYKNTPINKPIMIDNYILPHDENGIYHSLEQFASFIYNKTTKINQDGTVIQGVNISIQGGEINIFDSTTATTPVHILFTDLIGQPVWIATNQIQLKLVMRGDLNIGGTLILPAQIQNVPGLVLTSANAYPSQTKDVMNFNGLFKIIEMRHTGNYRSPQGDAWITTVSCLLD